MLTSKDPSTCIDRYAAGMVCRRVEVGVMGERKDKVISRSFADRIMSGARMEYVRLVVDASYFAPLYMGYATV